MSSDDEIRVGDRVRVLSECPHTLPAYARMMVGEVLGPTEDGALSIRFGEDHVFPVSAEWLEQVVVPADDD